MHDGDEEIALNGLLQAARAQGDYDFSTGRSTRAARGHACMAASRRPLRSSSG